MNPAFTRCLLRGAVWRQVAWLRVLAGVLASLLFSGMTCAQDSISWLRRDFPPVYIADGPEQGKGYFDQLEKAVIAGLPDLRHVHVEANTKRTLEVLRAQQAAATVALIRTPERAEFITFSVPAFVVLPNGVVFLRSEAARFRPFMSKDGHIDLDKLLADRQLKLGVAVDRRYAGVIDDILFRHKDQDNILIRNSTDITRGLVRMLIDKRVDYLLAYPTEATYYMAELDMANAIAYTPVQGMERYTLGYIGFPRNDWGRQMIERINPIVRRVRFSPEMTRHYERWLTPDTRSYYRKLIDEYQQGVKSGRIKDE